MSHSRDVPGQNLFGHMVYDVRRARAGPWRSPKCLQKNSERFPLLGSSQDAFNALMSQERLRDDWFDKQDHRRHIRVCWFRAGNLIRSGGPGRFSDRASHRERTLSSSLRRLHRRMSERIRVPPAWCPDEPPAHYPQSSRIRAVRTERPRPSHQCRENRQRR